VSRKGGMCSKSVVLRWYECKLHTVEGFATICRGPPRNRPWMRIKLDDYTTRWHHREYKKKKMSVLISWTSKVCSLLKYLWVIVTKRGHSSYIFEVKAYWKDKKNPHSTFLL
jgi:hypothetical protein